MRGSSRTKPNAALKRTTKAKALRLAREAKRNALVREAKKSRADVGLVMLAPVSPGDDVILGVRRGLIGHPHSPIFRIKEEDIVGAIEKVEELGGIVTKIGVLVLAQLVGHNLAMGSDGLAKKLAAFARIDLAQLEKDATEEAADEALAMEIARAKVASQTSGGEDPADIVL